MMRLAEVKNPVAYFCSEFAIDNDLPTYAGGLGVLAADILNTAASDNYSMVGIGLLYNGKEFIQHITHTGREEKNDSEFDHDTSFLRQTTIKGKPLILTLPSDKGDIGVKSYHLRIANNVILFFLSSNVDGNPPDIISDMDAIYRGDTNSQIRQQILLGVGGIKLMNTLNIKPSFYHINEGRPSFAIWEITANLMKTRKISFEDAWNLAKEKIIYTNHTLVAAGNLKYPAEVVKWYATPFAKTIGVDVNSLIKDGLSDPQTFSITLFALNISKKHTTVSKFHNENAKKEWPNYDWISITNGVNMIRWQDSDFRKPNLTNQEVWDLHKLKKRELMSTVIKRTGIGYDPENLVISWARRLAEYKQPKVIFDDITRLKNIASQTKPVQILFAGNSHSADPHAKSIIEEIIRIFSNELAGHAIFVPNYNISLANHLTSGSDVWLNTPKGNLEACGTSGMKAIANGVLNCTVLDGWTYEVDWEGIGWVIDPNNISNSFYNILENEIIPTYYDRDEKGIPLKWIERMRKSIDISKRYSCERMFKEYKEKLYY